MHLPGFAEFPISFAGFRPVPGLLRLPAGPVPALPGLFPSGPVLRPCGPCPRPSGPAFPRRPWLLLWPAGFSRRLLFGFPPGRLDLFFPQCFRFFHSFAVLFPQCFHVCRGFGFRFRAGLFGGFFNSASMSISWASASAAGGADGADRRESCSARPFFSSISF